MHAHSLLAQVLENVQNTDADTLRNATTLDLRQNCLQDSDFDDVAALVSLLPACETVLLQVNWLHGFRAPAQTYGALRTLLRLPYVRTVALVHNPIASPDSREAFAAHFAGVDAALLAQLVITPFGCTSGAVWDAIVPPAHADEARATHARFYAHYMC